MTDSRGFRDYLTELLVVFIGVALAFAVENWREERNERSVEREYLSGFRHDLEADLQMLNQQEAIRRQQLADALLALEFFDGRELDTQVFFEAYFGVLPEFHTVPNRNTMDEVLNSGSLRLISDPGTRGRLLDLYNTYGRIADTEEHMARDFDEYLYDTTFNTVPLQILGPWPDTPDNRDAAGTLLDNLTIANGLRLLVANLQYETGLLEEFATARMQVDDLLTRLPGQ